MTKANTKINIALMNTLMQQAPDARKPLINKIIDLYKDRKIKNFKTATNVINLLSSKKQNQTKKSIK